MTDNLVLAPVKRLPVKNQERQERHISCNGETINVAGYRGEAVVQQAQLHEPLAMPLLASGVGYFLRNAVKPFQ